MNTHFKAIHEQYVFWLETLGFTPETVCNYGYRVTDFFLWLESKDITHIVQVEQKHINDFFDCQQTRPNTKFKGRTLSASYLNDYFTATDKLCEFRTDITCSCQPPYRHGRIPKDTPNRAFYGGRNKNTARGYQPPVPAFRPRTQATQTGAVEVGFCTFLRLRIAFKRGI